MTAILDSFEAGELYSNEEIYRSLSVGNAGGVRAKTDGVGRVERLVVMTSVPSARQLKENPYHDRLEGDVLIYTGAGREGDQSASGPNARIVEQANIPFPIYGFMLMGSRRDPKFSSKRWAFLGLLEFLRCYREKQIDVRGDLRNTWIFELCIHASESQISTNNDARTMTDILANRRQDIEQEREIVSPVSSGNNKESATNYAFLEAVRRRLLSYDPREFEHLLHDLLVKSGFRDVEVTKFSQDGGIDVNARPGKDLSVILCARQLNIVNVTTVARTARGTEWRTASLPTSIPARSSSTPS